MENTPTPTPIPWKIATSGKRIIAETPSRTGMICVRDIATMSAYGPIAENHANAAMIVEAVNSHAGLVAEVAWLRAALSDIEIFTRQGNFDATDEPSAAVVCRSVNTRALQAQVGKYVL